MAPCLPCVIARCPGAVSIRLPACTGTARTRSIHFHSGWRWNREIHKSEEFLNGHYFRVRDVAVFDRSRPVEQIFTRPPLIVIEVLSPEDTWRRMEERVKDYLDFGVPHVWIPDPGPRRAWTATRDRFAETRILEMAGSAIAIPLEELFREWE